MVRNWLALCLVVVTAIISGCGYQLQKPLQVSAQAQPIFIEGELLLGIALKRQLAANGISTTKLLRNAGSQVKIKLIEDDIRSYSVSLDGRNAEVQRSMSASIEWKLVNKDSDTEKQLLSQTTVSAEQVQIQNPDNVSAQASEAELIAQELREQLAEKMLNVMRYRETP